jgi:hypothetical protein
MDIGEEANELPYVMGLTLTRAKIAQGCFKLSLTAEIPESLGAIPFGELA